MRECDPLCTSGFRKFMQELGFALADIYLMLDTQAVAWCVPHIFPPPEVRAMCGKPLLESLFVPQKSVFFLFLLSVKKKSKSPATLT